MSATGRFAISALAGIIAFEMARALGMPIWNNWFPPDATDVGVLTFVAVSFLLGRRAA